MVLPLELVLQTGIKTGKPEEGVNPSSPGYGEEEPLQKGHVPLWNGWIKTAFPVFVAGSSIGFC